ncbi:mannose-6-phosphate isomerase, class I [Anaerococcus sp. Marseille-P3625]|uniref:mannose-6-phosphate isomerase, class I n=1 Tax=Anaerococcus sp. Marseille-P3625 TaxID=1977277 RepID=UPI000C07561A|nr:mannose-6-phosphate isomerase, class I [Anaerococcus sp. Marseille-P3625]
MQKVLILEGKFLEKIWGGQRLKSEFAYPIEGENIGEYWAISAMESYPSIVTNGKLKGENLKDIYKNHRELFGNLPEKEFPLLVKIIDAKDDLSIQVHPDDQMAAKIENSLGKSECWYILNKNESSIIYGIKAKNKDQAIKLIDEEKWDELLKEVKVKKDDFFYVPAGTVHAIKKGCLILEIQQASDLTYRLYDYDRIDKDGKKRELHLEKSKEAIKINELENKEKTEKFDTYQKTELTANEFFQVRKYQIKSKTKLKRENPYLLEAVIEGSGKLIVDDEAYPIKKGDFFILTNEVDDYYFDGEITVVESNCN